MVSAAVCSNSPQTFHDIAHAVRNMCHQSLFELNCMGALFRAITLIAHEEPGTVVQLANLGSEVAEESRSTVNFDSEKIFNALMAQIGGRSE
jgi:hypothetical protein